MWCIPAAVATLQSAAQFALLGSLGREWINVLLQFPRWLAWACVTPAVIGLTRRVPIRRVGLARSIVVHAAAALACIVIIEVAWTQLALAVEPPRDVPPGMGHLVAMRSLVSPIARLAIGVICYSAVVAVVMAVDAVRESRSTTIRAAELERDLAIARVHALKMQVHPHFLFNTLHAIGILITEDPSSARGMVVRLGQLLRTTLQRAHRAEVPLAEEIALVGHYLGIEQVRFGDRLRIEYAVAEEVQTAYVPDLILQPLAENAIRHGVSQRPGSHRIVIRVQRRDTMLELSVEDDGAGIGGAASPLVEGIGLGTVRRRLEHLYGREHSLRLTNGPNGGAITLVSLPYHTTPMNAEDATAVVAVHEPHA